MNIRTGLALALIVPTVLTAQENVGAFWKVREGSAIFTPSSATGLRLQLRRTDDSRHQVLGFQGGYHPDSVNAWLEAVQPVVRGAGLPVSPAQTLNSPPLMSATGNSLRLTRSVVAGHWANQIRVVYDEIHPNGRDVMLDLKVRDVIRLLEVIRDQNALSRYRDEVVAQTVAAGAADTLAVDVEAKVRWTAKIPAMPSRSGQVIHQFTVLANGTVDPESFYTLFATDTALIAPARRIILNTAFVPAVRGGAPVRARTEQMLNYSGRPIVNRTEERPITDPSYRP